MRYVAICHDTSTYMHGRIVTERDVTHEKRIRVGRALVSEQRRYGCNDEATFRYRISHFVRQSIARSSSAGCWLATSHGFTTVSPRRRSSQCSRNILSLLHLEVRSGTSVGKVMATTLWDQDGILLADSLNPAIRSTVTGSPNSCGN